MKTNIRRLRGLTALLVFAVGVVLFANSIQVTRITEGKPFIVTYLVSKNGLITSFRIHSVKASGEWKNTTYNLGSQGARTLIGTLDAQYEVGSDSVNYLGSVGQLQQLDKSFRLVSFHKNHPEFVREEYIAGFKTYVHRAVSPDDPTFWVESSYAPEMGLVPLKTLRHYGEGNEFVSEAINIQFRDVADSEVALPNLPVSFDKIEQTVKDAQSSGDIEWADEQRKQIDLERRKQSAAN